MTKPNDRIVSVFDAALEFTSSKERAAYLGEVCAGDRALRERVEALLRAHDRSDHFLDRPAAKPVGLDEETGDYVRFNESIGTVIGPYKLLEQIGEGGFGVVYMAEQQQPVRRIVALKVLKPGMDTRQVVARFEAERQALALMEHPSIARILDAGATDSHRPYFVMELVKGISITQFCDDNRLTTRERLELFVAVCQAVQHAHQKGIIHRDIKPSNVLVTLDEGAPLVKVIDFGIAKALGQQRLTDKTLFTGLVHMIGTPLYMSPEQVEMSGQEADTRTDIYALGVLLYELLTGTTPFDKERLKEASYDEIRRIIREEEPAKPSTRISTLGQAASTISINRKSEPKRLSQLFRGELDWIVMKALEKDRNRRFETASSFAADVQRYLHDEPVQACPPSAGYRFRKFARRNKAALVTASAVAVAVLLAVAGLAVSTTLVWRANRELRQNLYYQNIAMADREWSANNLGRVEQLLDACPADLRGWEWHYLKGLRRQTLALLSHDSIVFCVVYSPTGQYLASSSRDGAIKVWDAHTGRPLRTFQVEGMSIQSVAFSPDGQRLAAGCSDGSVKIWDLLAGKDPFEWKAHPSRVSCVAFSPDGRRLASACASYGWEGQADDGEVKVWDAATGKQILPLRGHSGAIHGVAFSPDGRRLASAGQDKTVKVWEAATGRVLWTSPEHTAPVATLAYSPDGQFLASAGAAWSKLVHAEVKLWDAQTGEERLTLRGHVGYILSVAFSSDGQRLASAGMDRTVKLWDVTTGRETLTLRGHRGTIQAVAFSPDGRQLASAGSDQTVRIWDARPLEEKAGEEPLTIRVHPPGVLGVAFHPDGQRLFTVAGDGGVKLWDSRTGKHVRTFPDSQGFWTVAISPNGQRLAAGSGHEGGKRNDVKVWDADTGQEFCTLRGFSNVVKRVAFKSDSRHLVSAHWDRTVRIWDTALRQEVFRIPAANAFAIYGLALSPDGKSAVTASADEVKVWDATMGLLIKTLPGPHAGHPTCVAFRPDGKLLASASGDGTIKLWETQTWKLQEVVRDLTGGLYNMMFSPDGRVLAWGSTDATVKIWDARTKEIQSLRGHTSWVEDIAFSPDGKWIASASLDGTVKIWKTPPLVPVVSQAPLPATGTPPGLASQGQE
jgi:WD40 repeat protein/serine/threonine protein kinase